VLSRLLERRLRAWQVSEQWVFLNVPPAVARHLRFAEGRAGFVNGARFVEESLAAQFE
jgi:hypothetical protein